ncbi:MAG TPA: hypothetical protein VFA55_04840 [Candidatus Kapabacteria bacterium]|nr:hypothetical protein [Candidatus Kapabacteria bacterium]
MIREKYSFVADQRISLRKSSKRGVSCYRYICDEWHRFLQLFVRTKPTVIMAKKTNSVEINELLNTLTGKQKLLLAFLGSIDPYNANSILDPIRIMKGIFVISKKAASDVLTKIDRYEFVPYMYGPFSQEIYDNLGVLTNVGMVAPVTKLWQSWQYYELTPKGKEAAKLVLNEYDSGLRKFIGEVCAFVQNNTFATLLSKIYEEFPKYAVKSVFNKKNRQ